MNKRILAIVSGRVQMVMFRDFTVRRARKLGLVGFAENLSDGTVRVVAEGDEEGLDKLILCLNKGSILSRVENVRVSEYKEVGEFKKFNIKY